MKNSVVIVNNLVFKRQKDGSYVSANSKMSEDAFERYCAKANSVVFPVKKVKRRVSETADTD